MKTEEIITALYERARNASSDAECIVILDGLEEVTNCIRKNVTLPLRARIYADVAADTISNASSEIIARARVA